MSLFSLINPGGARLSRSYHYFIPGYGTLWKNGCLLPTCPLMTQPSQAAVLTDGVFGPFCEL